MRHTAALVVVAALAGCGADPHPSQNQEPALTRELVAAADLIFVGRIVGLADRSPEAQTRRHLETHLVDVQETLKGSDHTGQRLAARPDGPGWEDGKSYVLLVRTGPGNIVQPLRQPLLPATPERVTEVRLIVKETGGAVTERRIFWMLHAAAPSTSPLQEFAVSASGRFAWRRSQSSTSLSGSMPLEDVTRLTRSVESVDPGTPVDDGDVATFGWLDDAGARRGKSCTLPAKTACGAILQEIERLARQHGK
jgi:hypothetical protein